MHQHKHSTYPLREISLAFIAGLVLLFPASAADEVYGPTNWLKTVATPFGAAGEGEKQQPDSITAPISISGDASAMPRHLSLADRLVPARLFLPGRMVLGKSAEFVIKGRPGGMVALAMADKDSGARPIMGHPVHLGADRKMVSMGKIPESGVLSLWVETPIEGDLVGSCLYFSAVVWSKPDFSDAQVAAPVSAETQGNAQNGVMIAEEVGKKRGVRIVPDSAMPMTVRQSGGNLP